MHASEPRQSCLEWIWITENYQDSRHVASENQLWYVAQLAEMETR